MEIEAEVAAATPAETAVAEEGMSSSRLVILVSVRAEFMGEEIAALILKRSCKPEDVRIHYFMEQPSFGDVQASVAAEKAATGANCMAMFMNPNYVTGAHENDAELLQVASADALLEGRDLDWGCFSDWETEDSEAHFALQVIKTYPLELRVSTIDTILTTTQKMGPLASIGRQWDEQSKAAAAIAAEHSVRTGRYALVSIGSGKGINKTHAALYNRWSTTPSKEGANLYFTVVHYYRKSDRDSDDGRLLNKYSLRTPVEFTEFSEHAMRHIVGCGDKFGGCAKTVSVLGVDEWWQAGGTSSLSFMEVVERA